MVAGSRPRLTAIACVAGIALASARASAADPAAAEELFSQARDLMKSGQWELACKRLEESYALDAGIGTLFNLAACYEQQGRLATAWATYRDVAAATRAAGQPERERVAHDRAIVLEARLSYLVVELGPAQANADEVMLQRDGVVVGRSQWNRPIPVDPGDHVIIATAPRHKEFRAVVSIVGDAQHVQLPIPELAAEDTGPRAAVTTERPSAAVPAVLGAVGLVSIGVGTYFGFKSISQHDESKPYCDGNVCNGSGFDLRKSAIVSGNIATVLIGVGALAMVGAAVLWVALPARTTASLARGRVGARLFAGDALVTW